MRARICKTVSRLRAGAWRAVRRVASHERRQEVGVEWIKVLLQGRSENRYCHWLLKRLTQICSDIVRGRVLCAPWNCVGQRLPQDRIKREVRSRIRVVHYARPVFIANFIITCLHLPFRRRYRRWVVHERGSLSFRDLQGEKKIFVYCKSSSKMGTCDGLEMRAILSSQ